MAWQPNERVTFISHSGEKTTKNLDEVSGEGFAVLYIEGGRELIFTPGGYPINDTLDKITNGPRLYKLNGNKNQKKKSNNNHNKK